jgi:hypothetical protein
LRDRPAQPRLLPGDEAQDALLRRSARAAAMPYDAPEISLTDDFEPEARSRFRLAYQRCLPVMLALPESQLAPVNLDVRMAVMKVLGALPAISALRERAAALPESDLSAFDELGDYARALGHAHVVHSVAARRDAAPQALRERARRVRSLLVSDVKALVERELITPDPLGQLKGTPGYRNLAFDLLALVALLRDAWSTIEGRTALTRGELDQAEALAHELLVAYSRREKTPETSTEMRLRAFTLFVRAYDEVRRAVRYLRWKEGDYDAIAPSLYARDKRRRRTRPREQAASLGDGEGPSPLLAGEALVD